MRPFRADHVAFLSAVLSCQGYDVVDLAFQCHVGGVDFGHLRALAGNAIVARGVLAVASLDIDPDLVKKAVDLCGPCRMWSKPPPVRKYS